MNLPERFRSLADELIATRGGSATIRVPRNPQGIGQTLSDAFAAIERHELRVETLVTTPDIRDRLLAEVENSLNDEDTYFWGAKVLAEEGVPTFVVSELENCEQLTFSPEGPFKTLPLQVSVLEQTLP